MRTAEAECDRLRERAAAAEETARQLSASLEQERSMRAAAEARAAAAAAAAEALQQPSAAAASEPGGEAAGSAGADDMAGGRPAIAADGRDALLQEQAKQLLRMQRELASLTKQLRMAQRRIADLEGGAPAGATPVPRGDAGARPPLTAGDVPAGQAQCPAVGAAGAACAQDRGSQALRLRQLEDECESHSRRVERAEADARAALAAAAAEAARDTGRLWLALAERDAEISGLVAELAVVRAAAAAGAGR